MNKARISLSLEREYSILAIWYMIVIYIDTHVHTHIKPVTATSSSAPAHMNLCTAKQKFIVVARGDISIRNCCCRCFIMAIGAATLLLCCWRLKVNFLCSHR